jgi:hypothetical protein
MKFNSRVDPELCLTLGVLDMDVRLPERKVLSQAVMPFQTPSSIGMSAAHGRDGRQPNILRFCCGGS